MTKFQYGLLQQWSCLTNILITEVRVEVNTVKIGSSDFAKALGPVHHRIICAKLSSFRINIVKVK